MKMIGKMWTWQKILETVHHCDTHKPWKKSLIFSYKLSISGNLWKKSIFSYKLSITVTQSCPSLWYTGTSEEKSVFSYKLSITVAKPVKKSMSFHTLSCAEQRDSAFAILTSMDPSLIMTNHTQLTWSSTLKNLTSLVCNRLTLIWDGTVTRITTWLLSPLF